MIFLKKNINLILLIILIIFNLYYIILFILNKYNQKRYIINSIDNKTESNINFNNWNIKIDNNNYIKLDNFIENKKFMKDSYLLNINKEKFNIIEKTVYDLSIFHLKRLNLEIDFNRYKIEFWWKSDEYIKNENIVHYIHSDKDDDLIRYKNKLIHPILSTVTYINNSKYPTILTSTPESIISYNKINLKKGIIISLPKKLKHISFNGENLHGVINIFDKYNKNIDIKNRKTLMFNIWDNHNPLDVFIYNNIKNDNNFLILKKNKVLNLDIINNNFDKKIYLDEKEMIKLIIIILNNPIKLEKYIQKYNFYKNYIEYNNIIFDIK
jgi:hypothetical protein